MASVHAAISTNQLPRPKEAPENKLRCKVQSGAADGLIRPDTLKQFTFVIQRDSTPERLYDCTSLEGGGGC